MPAPRGVEATFERLVGAVAVRYLGYDALIQSKLAAGQPRDLADIDLLKKGRNPAP